MIANEDVARAWLATLPQCDELAMHRLATIVAMLTEENGQQNLVSAASMAEVWRRHIADSAQLLPLAGPHPGSWLDLGTGAGFPGLVVAALAPDLRMVMVESRKRRTEWLRRVVLALGLTQAEVIEARLEDIATSAFGVISARAFAPLPRLIDLSARFSTSETRWLLPKGQSATQEMRELRDWQHMFHVKQSLTDANAGIIVGNLLGRKDRRQ